MRPFLTIAGTIGSIMPDIDLENSKQSRGVFGGFGILLAFMGAVSLFKIFVHCRALSYVGGNLRRCEIFLLETCSTNSPPIEDFSTPCWRAYFLAPLVPRCFYNLFDKSDIVAWMGGALIFIGAITHLLLDELYSIDFAGNRVKRSFGTAMKLFDYRKPASALLMSTAACGNLVFCAAR